MSDSERRQKLILEYAEATNVRLELARKQLRELQELTRRFASEDAKAVRILNRMATVGDSVGLYSFQVTEAFESEEIKEMFADHLGQIEEDNGAIKELREEARDIDAEESGDDDEDDVDDDDDIEGDEEE